DILQVKYLNNIIEQDHRFIKKITKPMMGFKAFHSAQATIDGIETAHMIRKGQLSEENITAYAVSPGRDDSLQKAQGNLPIRSAR
ncbi:transposase, partial [Bathymodiolus platifrons methanotrophic gill symbiont]|uniref:transposase n=1 Tax=Bathymodiolus platifrons methanotrophic gill symbiont TaxID=113268 RepID=UPI001E3BA196